MELIQDLKSQKVLIVSDKGVEASGLLTSITDQLAAARHAFNGANGPPLQRRMVRIGVTEFSVVHGDRLAPRSVW